MDIFIRRAEEADIFAIHAIIVKNCDEILSRFHSRAAVEKVKQYNSPEQLSAQLRFKNVYVAVKNGRIAGTGAFANFGMFHGGEDRFSVSNLYVLPEMQGQGIGKALMAQLFGDARSQDARVLFVPSSLAAISFYESLGFRRTPMPGEERDETTWLSISL